MMMTTMMNPLIFLISIGDGEETRNQSMISCVHFFNMVVCTQQGKMDEYIHYHDNIWPEVAAGLRVAGRAVFETTAHRKLCWPWIFWL